MLIKVSINKNYLLSSIIILSLVISGTIIVITSSHFEYESDCDTQIQSVRVQGNSMLGFINNHQMVQGELGYYNCHPVQRGDLVLVKRLNSNEILVKSVAILPGDSFYLRGFYSGFNLIINNSLFLNPSGIPYLFTAESEKVLSYFSQSYSKKEDSNFYFVFGTNPHGSLDSSSFGPVLTQELIGKVTEK